MSINDIEILYIEFEYGEIVGARSLSGRAFSCTLGGWGGVEWGMW